MFGAFGHCGHERNGQDQNGRERHGRGMRGHEDCGPRGRMRGHGRGRPFGRIDEGEAGESRGFAAPLPAAAAGTATAEPQGGVCPLCKNHCPLSAPGCRRGAAYAAGNLEDTGD